MLPAQKGIFVSELRYPGVEAGAHLRIDGIGLAAEDDLVREVLLRGATLIEIHHADHVTLEESPVAVQPEAGAVADAELALDVDRCTDLDRQACSRRAIRAHRRVRTEDERANTQRKRVIERIRVRCT